MSQITPIETAVIPVAGLGTRFLPATKAMPKEMLPLVDRPLIQHTVEEAKAAGIKNFIFISGRHKELIEEHFDYQPELEQTLRSRGKTDMLDKVRDCQMPEGRFFLTRQNKPLGLGHAIWCAKEIVGNKPFAIMLPDDVVLSQTPCLKQMMDVYAKTGGNIVAVMDVPREDTHKYGILDIASEDGDLVKVKGLVEKPDSADAPSTLSIIGRYIVQPELFDPLSRFEKGAGGEIQLTDALTTLIGKQAFHGFRFEGTRYDCGSKLGFLEANVAFALADPNMRDQVAERLSPYFANKIGVQGKVEAA